MATLQSSLRRLAFATAPFSKVLRQARNRKPQLHPQTKPMQSIFLRDRLRLADYGDAQPGINGLLGAGPASLHAFPRLNLQPFWEQQGTS